MLTRLRLRLQRRPRKRDQRTRRRRKKRRALRLRRRLILRPSHSQPDHRSPSLRRLLYGCTDIAFAPHGAYWRGARKLAVLHLLSPGKVRAYRGVREELSELVRRVEDQRARGRGAVRLSELLAGFAKDVSGRIVLGVRASGGAGCGAKVDSLLDEANALLGTLHVGGYFPWLAWLAAVDGTDAKVKTCVVVARATVADDGETARFVMRRWKPGFLDYHWRYEEKVAKTGADDVRAVLVHGDRTVVVHDRRVCVLGGGGLEKDRVLHACHLIETGDNPLGLCAITVSPLPTTPTAGTDAAPFAFACSGVEHGEVHVERWVGEFRPVVIRAHDSRLACLAMSWDGRLVAKPKQPEQPLQVLIFLLNRGEPVCQ